MNVLYALDEVPCRDTNATALDSDATGSLICLGGARCLTVAETEKFVASPVTIRTNRQEVSIIRWRRSRDSENGLIAASSGQFVDIYAFSGERLNSLCAVRAHPLNVTDLDWCAYNANVFVTCSIDDAVSIWDVRDTRRSSARLNVVAGAEQAKFAPLAENILCTSHGTDIRLWDSRFLATPLQSIPAHMQKMCCVVWHPTDAVCFVTTSHDGYIKIWDVADLTKPRHSIGMLAAPVWKLKFSHDGDEFVSAPIPQGSFSSRNALTMWKSSELDNAQAVKCDDDVILDVCWQRSLSKRRAFKHLYSVSRSGKLRRYPLAAYELQPNNGMDVSARLAACESDAEVAGVLDEVDGTDLKRTDGHELSRPLLDAPRKSPSSVFAQLLGSFQHNRNEKKRFAVLKVNDEEEKTLKTSVSMSHLKLPSREPGTEEPPSPCTTPSLMDGDWKIWLRVPNVGTGVSYELDSLRNLGTQGLSTDEINFTRAAVALTYEHYQSGKKLKFLLRFHAASAKVHRICLEVIEEGSPLTGEQAAALLQLLSRELLSTISESGKGSILSRTLKRMPQLIESMKVFSPKTIDIPRSAKTVEFSSESASAEAEAHSIEQEINEQRNSLRPVLENQSFSSPTCSSAYDRFIPSPRLCGASFNGSGFLVVFGRVDFSKRKNESSTHDEMSKYDAWLSTENIAADLKRNKIFKKGTQESGRDKESLRITPRSLEDYNQEMLISAAAVSQAQTQLSVMRDKGGALVMAGSPGSISAVYAQFANTTGLVGGTGPAALPPSLHRASSASKTPTGRANKSSTASGTSRSFSMQNVPLSLVAAHRHRGNSLTGVLADDHYQLAECAPNSTVVTYDVSGLMTVNKDLARKYRLIGGDALELCMWNRRVVEEAGRRDLANIWRLIELCVRATKSSRRKHCGRVRQLQMRSDATGTASSPVADGEDESAESSDEDSSCFEPPGLYPFGRNLVNSLLDYFGRISDCQTATMIICVLSERVIRDFVKLQEAEDAKHNVQRRTIYHGRSNSSSAANPGGLSGHNTIHGALTTDACRKFEQSFNRSYQQAGPLDSSCRRATVTAECEEVSQTSESPPDRLSSLFRPKIGRKFRRDGVRMGSNTIGSASEAAVPRSLPSMSHSNAHRRRREHRREETNRNDEQLYGLLDPRLRARLEEIREEYADLLFRWRMFSKVAEVMKFCQDAPISLPFFVRYKCRRCGSPCEVSNRCVNCTLRPPPFKCVICELPMHGLLTTCVLCHHGGHAEHLIEWFESNKRCPAACGCECALRSF